MNNNIVNIFKKANNVLCGCFDMPPGTMIFPPSVKDSLNFINTLDFSILDVESGMASNSCLADLHQVYYKKQRYVHMLVHFFPQNIKQIPMN